MNTCLIAKWWWKICTADPETMGHRILQAKYFPASSALISSGNGGFQFWRHLIKVRDIFRDNVTFSVGNSRSVRFWRDKWSEAGRLAEVFPTLFSFCLNPHASIADLASGG